MSKGALPESADSTLKMTEYDEKRRKKRICVAVMAVVVVITMIVVALGLTVFKGRDPDVRINTINLESFGIGLKSLNMSLLLEVTVHNPNREGFTYTDSLTRLFYYGDPVGQAVIPAGYTEPTGSDFLSVLVVVEAGDRVLVREFFPGNIASGRLPVVATTTVAGVVKVLGAFKHHAVTTLHCDIVMFVANATIQSFACRHGMKL